VIDRVADEYEAWANRLGQAQSAFASQQSREGLIDHDIFDECAQIVEAELELYVEQMRKSVSK